MMAAIRLILVLIISAFLAGCNGRGDITSPYPDPVKFEVRGIDISAHNGEVDFVKVKASGMEFVIIKATEGATFKDKRFIDNFREARAAGLKVGAYHFFRFDSPGYMQGLNLLNSVNSRELDLPLVIDLEEWTNPNRQATPLVISRLTEMIDHLEGHGYRVMLYTNKNGYTRFVKGRLEGYPLWICSLAEEPVEHDWQLWQATHNGRVDGIDHPVDINAFRGDRERWLEFASGAAVNPPAQIQPTTIKRDSDR